MADLDDLECEGCGHIFDTVDERRDHERRAERGERVLCPCDDVCSEGHLDD